MPIKYAVRSICRQGASEHLGAQIGALAVLHTWTRTLEWHPHVHLLVPGGGLAADGRTWCSVPVRRKRFLVPIKPLGELFRARFLHLARRALPGVPLLRIPWNKRWVVFAKPAVRGSQAVLEYLGRYVQRTRTALTDSALVAIDETTVTFRYLDHRDERRKTMTLSADEFLRRFLQHVPPKGFHRVRAFGLLHAEHRLALRRLQLLLESDLAGAVRTATRSRPGLICPSCGKSALQLLRRLSAAQCLDLTPAVEVIPLCVARGPPVPPIAIVVGTQP